MVNGLDFIAVVDDEPGILKALERLLRSARFEVATFSSGEAFLSSLSGRKPACVLLDLHMPGMDGFDVQSRLATSADAEVPVIIMTAHDAPTSRQRAMAGRASAYLRKPIDAPSLLSAVRAAIEQRSAC